MILEISLSMPYSGQFLMTEVGHGLDIANLETTATLLHTGEFMLNTPHANAAKYVCRSLPSSVC